MFQPHTLKQLITLTSIDTFSCLGGTEVTHRTAVPEVSDSIPGSVKDLLAVVFLCFLLMCFNSFVQMNICHELFPLVVSIH